MKNRFVETAIKYSLIVIMFNWTSLFGAFGDTNIHKVSEKSSIPKGWVILSRSHSTLSGFSVIPTYTILDLNDAPYGATCVILAESPIPYNWIITSSDCVGSMNRYQVPNTYTITNLNGASLGATVSMLLVPCQVMPGQWTVVPSPTPVGESKAGPHDRTITLKKVVS